jgi:hypothetical protein
MDSGFNTVGTGTERATAELCGSTVWLRVTADIRPGAERQANFSYSEDGSNFIPLGTSHTLGTSPAFFMGPRFAIFNHATQALGGAVTVKRFSVTM